MNKLQLTAIVVTVAIIMPIGLGYLMAVEEVERTGWGSTSSANLSDLMLNSETEYYTVSNVPLNNAEIFVDGTDLMSPEYVSVGSNATSLPEYTSTSSAVPGEVDTETRANIYNIDVGADIGAIEISSSGDYDLIVGNFQMEYTGTITIVSYDGSIRINNQIVASGTLSDNTITITVDLGSTATIRYYHFVDLPSTGDYSFSSSAVSSIFRIVSASGTQYIRSQDLSKTANTVVLGIPKVVIEDVTSIEVVTAGETSYGSTTVVSIDRDSYGNPAYGWTMPGAALLPKDWANGQYNRSVEFMVSMNDGDLVIIQPWNSDAEVLLIAYTDGETRIRVGVDTSVPAEILGNYPNLRVVVRSDGIDVFGIPEWPPMFTPATDINSFSYDHEDVGDFPRVRFIVTGETRFRVDSATIVAGTFPVADDFSLDLGEYWPGDSWAIRMPNIGIYGDSLTFGGNVYDVENGRITLMNGTDLSLLDVTLSGTFTEGIWTYSINNVEQSTSTELLPVIFGGVWSATVTGYKMEQITETALEWIPGEFVLDDSGFILAALAGVALAFVGLALYGRRSGGKVFWLLVICGAVAFIFISMI